MNPADLAAHVDAFARKLVARPREVLALTKLGVYASLQGDLESALQHEALAQAACNRSPAAREGMKRFLNRSEVRG